MEVELLLQILSLPLSENNPVEMLLRKNAAEALNKMFSDLKEKRESEAALEAKRQESQVEKKINKKQKKQKTEENSNE